MSFYARRFNLYLLLLALAGGCTMFKSMKKDDVVGQLRIHVESSADLANRNKTISVVRAEPVSVPISAEPVLTEANLLAAKVIETPGGFAIKLKFDESGGWMLEQCSAANPGRHLVIFGQWGKTPADGRWLAAPLITHRIAGGELTFTPDASREEAQKFADNLNLVSKKLQTGVTK